MEKKKKKTTKKHCKKRNSPGDGKKAVVEKGNYY